MAEKVELSVQLATTPEASSAGIVGFISEETNLLEASEQDVKIGVDT